MKQAYLSCINSSLGGSLLDMLLKLRRAAITLHAKTHSSIFPVKHEAHLTLVLSRTPSPFVAAPHDPGSFQGHYETKRSSLKCDLIGGFRYSWKTVSVREDIPD
jgi:hypothetical protein